MGPWTTNSPSFVRIHESAMSEALTRSLSFYESIRRKPLGAPVELTDLWLASQWSRSILRWNMRTGWRRDDWHAL